MTSNKVFINSHNIVEIHVVGDQTRDSVLAMGKETERLLRQLNLDGKPLLILDNILEMGTTDTAARQAVSQLARTLPYRKVAMLGSNAVAMRVGTQLLLQAIGMGKKIRYFGSHQAAVRWLTRP